MSELTSSCADDLNASRALFVQLLSKHQRKIYAFIRSLTPTTGDADDIMQDTSLVLWEKWEQFDQSRDFFKWACGFANIQVLRHRRKSATDRLWFDDELLQLLASQMLDRVDLFDLRREALDKCIQKLAADERTVVEHYYREGMSISNVAEKAGTSMRSIHRKLARARRALQRCISAAVPQ
ncbi:RNA polymerase sigma factor [Posidoniimonas corsicana]|uniref:RNA polymerase sigma factor n=1 Tax=Posidoniimonas corsicana TaxID=1938618 RepID=A0A5C5V7V8_9BACT|nr:sigma-70 family RNA polymerase sigma factor [Posidoniimonas corsicana]TWT33917.1 RNA polymerase sigma factor [Posidoniimonas corsicana]